MKKKHEEEHTNAEAWAVPYADLLTLLLAFFVVMYSLSQINQSKYRVLAEALYQAFNGTGRVIQPVSPATPARTVPLPDKARAANARPVSRITVPLPPQNLPLPGHEGAAAKPSNGTDLNAANLKAMSDKIAKALKPWIDSGQVIIRKSRTWLEIEIRTDVLFPSGVAALSAPAKKVLDGVATVLARYPNPVRIEGFTDSQPIDTLRFPSNWELSAARAGSVARLLGDQGVDPSRMGIFGWGQYHPVASNTTADGRRLNRRIAIVVLSVPDAQQQHADQTLAAALMAHDPAIAPHTAPATRPAATARPRAAHDRDQAVGAVTPPSAAALATAPGLALQRPR